MNIDKARTLTAGSVVYCPADRGDKAFVGKVVSQDCDTSPSQLNHKQECFIWVEVQGLNKKSIWPSNRLG